VGEADDAGYTQGIDQIVDIDLASHGRNHTTVGGEALRTDASVRSIRYLLSVSKSSPGGVRAPRGLAET
jgi:hypothetical protein